MLIGGMHVLGGLALAGCALIAPFASTYLAVLAKGYFTNGGAVAGLGLFGLGLFAAAVLAAAAVLFVGLGMGLVRGSNGARLAVIGLQGIGLVSALGSFAVIRSLWHAGVVYYLTRPNVARAFR